MLSQSLVRSALALEVFPAPAERQQNLEELHATLLLWQRNQEGLQHGDCALGLPGNNSDVVTHLFAAIHPDYLAMVRAANELQRMLTSGTTVRAPDLLPDIRSIMSEQVKFLTGMDRVVTQYQREAEDHMSRLRLIEFTLLGLTLCVLLLEGLYIFRPTVLRLRQTILDLRMANERIVHAELTRKKAERLLALNEALSSRYQQEPQARIVELGHYQVRDRDGSYYDVYQREQDGQSQFVCSYEAYRQHEICAHSLAAAALHRVSGFPT